MANCIRKPIRHIFDTGEFAANIICLHSQGYSPQCESSISEGTFVCTSHYVTHTYMHRGISVNGHMCDLYALGALMAYIVLLICGDKSDSVQ